MRDVLMIRLFFVSIAISLFFPLLYGMKRLLIKQTTASFQYKIWYTFFIVLSIPFLPTNSFVGIKLSNFFHNDTITYMSNSYHKTPSKYSENVNWMRNFSVSMEHQVSNNHIKGYFTIWIVGCLIFFLLWCYNNLKLQRIKKTILPLQNDQINELFLECKSVMKVRSHVLLFSSAYIYSPITIGLIHPSIILPIDTLKDCNTRDIKYILCHELEHCKHKDIIIRYFMCVGHILYWFHPIVWTTLKEMYNDCEISCDIAVLNALGQENSFSYGNTLINFAEKITLSCFSVSTSIGSKQKQIKKRILNIASFQSETRVMKIKSKIFYFVTVSIVIFSIPVFSVSASTDYYKFSEKNIVYQNLESYFKDFNGCFVLYNPKNDQWFLYNKVSCLKRTSPYSTYKIYSALFALEQNIITPNNSLLPWDGSDYYFDIWEKDQTLTTAMQTSANWYFQKLDMKSGKKKLLSFYKSIHYGNADLEGNVATYWLGSSLKISPVEQVELLYHLFYKNKRFQQKNIQAVKDSLYLSEENGSRLYGKTGTGNNNNSYINGWFVGMVERNDTTYYFATNIQSDQNASGSIASQITLQILDSYHIYKDSN